MDYQKGFRIFDPKADRNNGAALVRVIRYVPITVRSRKCMVPEWTIVRLDRACGCKPAAVDARSLGVARAVAAMNGGGLMNSYRRREG